LRYKTTDIYYEILSKNCITYSDSYWS
jgi:hypothetical protein